MNIDIHCLIEIQKTALIKMENNASVSITNSS